MRGSGNAFRDLGAPDAALLHLKATIAGEIIRALDTLELSVRAAAAPTGFAAADFSRVRQAKVRGFTLDKLVSMLGKLDRTVELSVRVRPSGTPVAVPADC